MSIFFEILYKTNNIHTYNNNFYLNMSNVNDRFCAYYVIIYYLIKEKKITFEV